MQWCRHNGSHTFLQASNTSGLRPGYVYCVVRTNVFERYSHPSELPSELHRLQRESMFLSRGLSLCQIWWGAILDVVAFKEPFPLRTSDGGLNSCPRHECCMTLPGEYDRLLAKRVTHQGHDVSLAHVLRQWQDDGCQTSFTDLARRSLRLAGIQVPSPCLRLIQHGRFGVVSYGDNGNNKYNASVVQFLSNCKHLPHAHHPSEHTLLSMDSIYFNTCAAILRGAHYDADGSLSRNDILLWLDSMGASDSHGLRLMMSRQCGSTLQSTGVYDMEMLLKCLRIATVSKGDKHLESIISICGELIGFSTGWLQRAECRVPSRQTLGKARFKMDATLCKLTQHWIKGLLTSGTGFRAFLLSDASPRVGRDWLGTELYIILLDAIPEFMTLQNELCELARDEVSERIVDQTRETKSWRE